jgi:putative SOS response-associated peptidase YedK
MCGRFTNRLTWEEIVRLYRLTIQAPPHNLPPRYNICPADPVDVVTERDGNRDFVRMRWGLVPSWWPKPLKDLKVVIKEMKPPQLPGFNNRLSANWKLPLQIAQHAGGGSARAGTPCFHIPFSHSI